MAQTCVGEIGWLNCNLTGKQFFLDSASHSYTSTKCSQGGIQQELGKIEGFKAKLYVNPQVKPIFFKPRQVPQAMKEKIETELRSLEEQGIIAPVKYSSWAAPVVPVLKPDGTLRLCGDYKVT